MKKEVKIHIRSFPNLHVYVTKVNKHSLPKAATTADYHFKIFPNAFLMEKKLPLRASCVLHKISTEMKLSLGASMN
jgi:hypothetical protein